MSSVESSISYPSKQSVPGIAENIPPPLPPSLPPQEVPVASLKLPNFKCHMPYFL